MSKELTVEEIVENFVINHEWAIDDFDAKDLVELIREAEERGRVEMREKCAVQCDNWAEFQREEQSAGYKSDGVSYKIDGRLDASEN
jgi:hypothetical protein